MMIKLQDGYKGNKYNENALIQKYFIFEEQNSVGFIHGCIEFDIDILSCMSLDI